MTRRTFLRGLTVSAALTPLGARATHGSGPKNLVVFMAAGGWDTTYCMDPKLGVSSIDGPDLVSDPNLPDDVEALQTFGEIPILVNDSRRPEVSRFFADWHQQTAVVNGLWMKAIAHQSCLIRLLTGTPSFSNPDITTITGYALGEGLPLGSVDFSGFGSRGTLGASAGRIGLRNQLKALVDPTAVYRTPETVDYDLPLFGPSDTQRDRVAEYLAGSADHFDRFRGNGERNQQHVANLLESMHRSDLLRDRAPEVLADLPMGGVSTAPTQLETAVRLLKSDICRTVLVDHHHPWDTHSDNQAQHDNFDDYFGALSHLCSTLDAEGILDDTLVLACSEMGRTPKLNARQGKEHWPHSSVMFIGGGVDGGRAFGGTSAALESATIDPVSGEPWEGGITLAYDNLTAGVLQAMGVDPEPWFPDVVPYVGPLHG